MKWIDQLNSLASKGNLLTDENKVNEYSELQNVVQRITCRRLRNTLSMISQDALTHYLTVVRVNPDATYQKAFMKIIETRKNALHSMGIEIEINYQLNTTARIAAKMELKAALLRTS